MTRNRNVSRPPAAAMLLDRHDGACDLQTVVRRRACWCFFPQQLYTENLPYYTSKREGIILHSDCLFTAVAPLQPLHGARAEVRAGAVALARVARGLELLLVLPGEVVQHVERRVHAAVDLVRVRVRVRVKLGLGLVLVLVLV